MIYVAQIMNGEVTVGISLLGIEADTFEKAKTLLKNKVEGIAEVDETEDNISFDIPQSAEKLLKASVYMNDKPLEIW